MLNCVSGTTDYKFDGYVCVKKCIYFGHLF